MLIALTIFVLAVELTRPPGHAGWMQRSPWAVAFAFGQLLFVACVLATRSALRRLSIRFPQPVRALPAYSIGSLAVLWMCERIAALF